jgi:hypothetical protein
MKNFFPRNVTIMPNVSINGTVPRLNINIDNAPENGLADASATN